MKGRLGRLTWACIAVLGLLAVWYGIDRKHGKAAEAAGADKAARSVGSEEIEEAAIGSWERPVSPAYPALHAPDAAELDEIGPHPDALAFGSDAFTPQQEGALLYGFLQLYRTNFGAFPSGSEARHFVYALQGANPGRLPIFPLRHARLTEEGDLLDAWGTPFHFHLISQQNLEIRSAGPDRSLFTPDDLVHP